MLATNMPGQRTRPGSTTGKFFHTAVFSVALLSLGGCGSVYFHDAEREASLTQAKDDFAAAAPATVFEQQRAYLKDLAEAERESVVRNFTARRNLRLALWLSPPSDSSKPGWLLMKSAVEGRAAELAGDNWSARKDTFAKDVLAITYGRLNLIKSSERVTGSWTAYNRLPKEQKKIAAPSKKSANPVEAICDQIRGAKRDYPNPHDADEPGYVKFQILALNCQGFDTYDIPIKTAEARFRDVSAYGSGLIRTHATRLDEISGNIKSMEAESKLLKCELEKAIAAYEEAEKTIAPADLEAYRDRLLETIKTKVNEVLDIKNDVADDAKKAKPKAGEKCSQERQARDRARKDDAKPQAKNKSWFIKVRTKALAYLNAWLAKKINETVESGLTDATDQLSKNNRALLGAVFKANANFQAARRAGELNAMLTSLAYVRFQHARAETALAYEKSKLANAKELLDAALREFNWLSQAHTSAKKPLFDLGEKPDGCAKGKTGLAGLLDACKKDDAIVRAVSESLAAFVTSTSQGRLPMRLAEYHGLAIDREFAISTEENAANVQFAAIQPLADQLAAFGKGGVKREALLGLLQAAGIFTIAAD